MYRWRTQTACKNLPCVEQEQLTGKAYYRAWMSLRLRVIQSEYLMVFLIVLEHSECAWNGRERDSWDLALQTWGSTPLWKWTGVTSMMIYWQLFFSSVILFKNDLFSGSCEISFFIPSLIRYQFVFKYSLQSEHIHTPERSLWPSVIPSSSEYWGK